MSGKKNSAFFITSDDGLYFRSCKDAGLCMSGAESLFGTDNDLFKGDGDITRLFKSSGESCQASSIIWCKKCLLNPTNGPSRNVHKEDKKEIEGLLRKMQDWDWEKKTWAAKETQLSALVRKAQLKPVRVGQSDAYDILRHIVTRSNKIPVVIWMKRHVIGVYPRSIGCIYVFDNTAGCIRFLSMSNAFEWITWACAENNELKKKVDTKWRFDKQTFTDPLMEKEFPDPSKPSIKSLVSLPVNIHEEWTAVGVE